VQYNQDLPSWNLMMMTVVLAVLAAVVVVDFLQSIQLSTIDRDYWNREMDVDVSYL
jgi:hypothetical protein